MSATRRMPWVTWFANCRKHEQHALLCSSLARAGWRVHSGAPVVLPLGTAGTVYTAWRDAALLLGVPAVAVPPLLRALHLHSVDAAAAIDRTRLYLERSPGGGRLTGAHVPCAVPLCPLLRMRPLIGGGGLPVLRFTPWSLAGALHLSFDGAALQPQRGTTARSI